MFIILSLSGSHKQCHGHHIHSHIAIDQTMFCGLSLSFWDRTPEKVIWRRCLRLPKRITSHLKFNTSHLLQARLASRLGCVAPTMVRLFLGNLFFSVGPCFGAPLDAGVMNLGRKFFYLNCSGAYPQSLRGTLVPGTQWCLLACLHSVSPGDFIWINSFSQRQWLSCIFLH